MKKYIFLFLMVTLIGSAVKAQTQYPYVLGYSAGENVEVDTIKASFSGGASLTGNGVWNDTDAGRVLAGFRFNSIIVPETFEKDLSVSKGYFDNFVDINWRMTANENVVTRFKIFRKHLGSSEDSIEVANLAADVRNWRDEYTETGVMYQYFLYADGIFGEAIKWKNIIDGIGFRIPYGVISGRTTFTTGNAVQGVEIMAEADEDFSGSSLYLNGIGAYLAVSPRDGDEQFFFDTEFTFQTWLKALSTTTSTIFEKGNQYKLTHAPGQITFTAGGQDLVLNFDQKADTFFNVTAARTADSLKLYVIYDNRTTYKVSALLTGNPIAVIDDIIIGKSGSGEYFEGYIDEMRIWHKTFSDTMIYQETRRYIAGTEPGMTAYYRFNEAVGDAFYDLAREGFDFHENHGYMYKAQWATDVPFPKQLNVKGISDENGNYSIPGIPYSSTGTNYRFIPVFDVHEFDPSEKLLFMGPGASSHSGINFTDIAAFIVKGNVKYKDTYFPVKGANLYIDDRIVVKTTGEPVVTDDFGNYTISVPIGYHTIKVGMMGHVFREGGTFPLQSEDPEDEPITWNFQEPFSGLDFVDTTLVKVIGRIVGGPREQAKPKGLGKTTNNIGFGLLEMTTQRLYDLTDNSEGIDDVWLNTIFQDEISSDRGETRHVIAALSPKSIKIFPDHETGEFVAYLLPEKYIITGIQAGSYNYPEKFNTTIDLTQKYTVHTEIDSVKTKVIKTPENDTIQLYQIDSIQYNHNLDLIYREIPSVGVTSKDDNPIFWETELKAKDNIVVSLVNEDETLKTAYPVLKQRGKYDLKIAVFEKYINSDAENAEDLVPVTDGTVEIQNGLAIQKSLQSISINKLGNAYYSFSGGLPNITTGGLGDYLLTMAIVAKTGQNGSIMTPWLYNNETFRAYLIGGMPTGSNFISTGPNEMITILRDPPGSNSYSYLEKGAEFSKSSSYSVNTEQAASANLTASFGTDVILVAGSPTNGVISETRPVADVSGGLSGSTAWDGETSNTTTITNTQTWTTSDSEDFVGAQGDVFIGYSTNIVYGLSTQIELIPTDMPLGSGFVGNPFDQEGVTYDIGMSKGLRMSPEFKTMFQYSQSHIELYLIPNLELIRNNYLASHDNYQCVVCDQEDENYASNNSAGNLTDEGSWLGGNSYNYTEPLNLHPDSSFVDSVKFFNSQIAGWVEKLMANEKAKVNAEDQDGENVSFDGGTTYENSVTVENTHEVVKSFEFNITATVGTAIGLSVFGVGSVLELEMSNSFGGGYSNTTSSTKSTTYGYVLDDGDAGDYISVDVKRPIPTLFPLDTLFIPSGPVFLTRGGQTMCPYQGSEITEYYSPGTKFSEATMQREIPKISCENPLQVNVPEDVAAVFKIQLRNESETGDGQWFIVRIDQQSNENGASVSMDGASIANGIMVLVNAGETLNKYIYVNKLRADEYNYENLGVIITSACQNDPTDFQDDIADTLRISASFQPVCTGAEVLSPENQWVLNTNGDTTLTVNISDYDYQHASFNNIALKYKSTSTSSWATEMIFYVNENDYNAANEPKIFMNGEANMEFVFDWSSMQDRNYNIKATSYCVDGTDNDSEILTGIKDVKRPQVFGSPQPADGILTSNDDIMITFDEVINAGLLLPYNFSVKGVLNGNEIKHQSCVFFDGADDYATSIKGVNLDDKSWTIEFWLRRGDLTEGVIFSQSGIEIGFDASNKFYLNAGGQVIVSDQTIEDVVQWKHYAVTYNIESETFEMYINDKVERELLAQTSDFSGNGKMYLGKSPDAGNFVNAYIHELRVWEKALGFGTVYSQMYKTLAGNEIGLGGYWAMDEARGDMAADKSRARHALFFGAEWRVFPTGYAQVFDGAANIDISTGSSVVITEQADFTIEFYFKGEAQANTVLFSNGKGDGTDIAPAYENIWLIGFNANGELYAKNNGAYITIADKDFLDNKWHHFAIVKNEISNGSVFIDGNLEAYEQSLLLGGLNGSVMTMGARLEYHFGANLYDQNFVGQIDEFRIWNLARTKKHLNLDMNSKLRGDEMGLVAYYPFDKYNDLGIALDPTLEDITGGAANATTIGGTASNVDVPNIKDARPVQDVAFTWVVNEDQVIININEQPSLIEKTVLEFTIDRVEDLRENRIASPATWTAYIKQNSVIWNDEFLNIKKEAYSDYKFDIDVMNIGGTEQSFHISGLPSWLSVDIPDGTIAPDSYLTLHFQIDPVVNIGYYDFSLFLESEFGYPEKLNVDLTVFKPTPTWDVTPGDFQYSMSVIGQVKINNVISDDTNDVVAAFVDGVCRGLVNISYVQAYDNFEVYLNIYSNTPSGEKVEFRIWDASEGQIITDVIPEITFANNGLIGTPSEPIDILANAFYETHIPLKSGWNWVSFNLDSDDLLYTDSLFREVNVTDRDMIKSATAFDIYASTTNSWFGTLAAQEGITQGKNYMINVANFDTLVYKGVQTDPNTQIDLVVGWNWLGYIPLSNMSLNEAFSGFNPQHNDVIKSQNAFAYFDGVMGWIGSLEYMRSGVGYLYKSNADVSFSYPERNLSFKSDEKEEMLTNVPTWNINRTKYSDNMSVIAEIVGGDFNQNNLVLGAFVGNECRGIVEPILTQNKLQFYLTVYGNEYEDFTFRLIDTQTGVEYQASEIASYTENTVEGTPSTPFLLNFDKNNPFANAMGGLLEVYPNPFSSEIQLFLSNAQVIDRIEITNAIGMKITEITPANSNKVVWNSQDASGNIVPGGIYFVKVHSGTNIQTTKIIKLK